MLVLPGKDDHLGVRRRAEDLLQQLEAFRGIVGVRRQAEIHGDDRRPMAPHEGERLFALAGADRAVLIERPGHLRLQRRIVLYDE